MKLSRTYFQENHKFLWTAEDASEAEKSWDKMLAKKYYDKLFKEYCIADLSQYEKNRVAMRWRIESEVKNGKGQFICGEKRCQKEKGLESWEVNFAYMEKSEKKHALVKLRLCPECSLKLNFHSMKRKITKKNLKRKSEKDKKSKKKKRRSRSESSSESGDDSSESSSSEEESKPGPSGDYEAKRKAEEEKLEAEASNAWTKEPEEQNPDEEMDKFLDDLLF